MSIQRQRLIHKFPGQRNLINRLYDFCNQPDTNFHFSENEFTALCDWLVNQSYDEAEAFWAELAADFNISDLEVLSFLRMIIPRPKKVFIAFFSSWFVG